MCASSCFGCNEKSPEGGCGEIQGSYTRMGEEGGEEEGRGGSNSQALWKIVVLPNFLMVVQATK